MQILPVILAGGLGTRLAPLSSTQRPKPFIPFRDGLSLYQHTLLRAQAEGFLPPLVIASADQRFALSNHAYEVGAQDASLLLETSPLGTALVTAVAVHWAKLHQPHAVIAVIPCDHAIADARAWRKAVLSMAQRVQGRLQVGLLGIKPTYADSGVGYIQADAQGNVRAFREKPSDVTALLASGDWMVNCGHVIASLAAFEQVFLQHAPVLWHQAEGLLKTAVLHYEFLHLPPHATDSISFDRAVLEHAASMCQLACLPCDWADVGTPDAWCAHTHDDWATQCAAPMRMDRPWGYFTVQQETPEKVIKTLHVYPGRRLSMQRHQLRSEHWRVISGCAQVVVDGSLKKLQANHELMIVAGQWHRLENNSAEMLVIEETQAGKPDEADIERADDDFGRT